MSAARNTKQPIPVKGGLLMDADSDAGRALSATFEIGMRYHPIETDDAGKTELYERPFVAVARVTKTRRTKRRIYPPSARFYTTAARNRFLAYADSLTIEEALEALGA